MLGLNPATVQAVRDLGYETPTPIQADMIPVLLSGSDAVGQAQTGTGKTAAFALPMIDRIETGLRKPQGLILAPTRELAVQIATALHQYGRGKDVRVLPVYGGQPYQRQIDRLKKGVDIVVGTPGRLLDLLNKKVLDLSDVRTVVLDEADEMLSMGFIEDIESILDATPDSRQTALLSATMPSGVRRLADKYLRDPKNCTITPSTTVRDAIQHRAYLVRESDKTAALMRLMESESVATALVFVQTRMATNRLASDLTRAGFPAEALSGEMSQSARTDVLHRVRKGHVTILVATDVAARGIDIDLISHVFNYDLPMEPEVYIHRVGRTGRAGRTGTAISLVSQRQQGTFRRIEKLIRHSVPMSDLPSVEDILRKRDDQVLIEMREALSGELKPSDLQLVNALWAEGFDPIAIAAAALSRSRTDEDVRSVTPIAPVKAGHDKKSAFNTDRKKAGGKKPFGKKDSGGKVFIDNADMVQLSLDAGKQMNIQPSQVVSAIARHADIPGTTIGKIRIRDKHTLVDVHRKHVNKVLARTGEYRFGKHLASIERA